MKKLYLAVPLIAAAMLAGCKSDTITQSGMSTFAGGPRYTINGAINTNFFTAGTPGTCSGVNGNLYANQFVVGVNGDPSNLTDGAYYVEVIQPGNTTTDPGRLLGISAGPTWDGSTCSELWNLVQTPDGNNQPSGTTGFLQTNNGGGEYRVIISHTSAFDGGDTKSDNFKIADFVPPDCTTDCPTSGSLFTVQKFYDANLNGTPDVLEPIIEGWNVDLTLGAARDTVATSYSIEIPDGTAFSATELMPSTGTWVRTTPVSGTISGTTSGQTIYFGNVCLAGGGGLTLGYWSNKNGQAAMGATAGGISSTLTFLNGLPLANATGNQPDFTSYTGFRTWILGATATNMAYMLSAQLAAMELNVRNAGLNGNALVYAPAVTGSTGVGGFISINDLMAAAVTALSDQVTLSGDPNRTMQEAIKSALDAANNNLNFLSATPCSITGATWTGWPL